MDLKTKKQQTKRIGDYGEEIASNYLKKKGFYILDRNYRKKWGELDIVAKNNNIIHFIEVKTLAYDSKIALERALKNSSWRPEEQVHDFKLKQIQKALETWLLEHHFEGEWQIDVVAVRLVVTEKYATVKMIDNVIRG